MPRKKQEKVEIKVVKDVTGLVNGQTYHVDSYTAKVMVENGNAELTSKKSAAPKKSTAKKPAAKKKTTKKED